MSQKKQARRNTSALPALQPDYSTAVVVRVIPDLDVEEFWFRMYQQEKRKADDLLRQKRELVASIRQSQNWRKVKRLIQLKPHSTREN
jgi:hypothetical protein